MVRKSCRGITETAVMEMAQLGVRTRARTHALAVAATRSRSVNRRKVNRRELDLSTTPCAQFRSRRRLVIPPENSASLSPAMLESNVGRPLTTVLTEDQCSSPSPDHVPTSCCSSNRSEELVEERISLVDLEDENGEVEASTYNCSRARRELSTQSSHLQAADSNNMESTVRLNEANSGRRLTPEKMMPTDCQLEEFFAAAEKDIQKRFMEKYNYDIVKDAPLEGRYEWVRLKP